MLEVLPGLRQVHPGLGSSNVFLWKGNSEVVLIDAGLEPDADAVLDAVRQVDSEPADITHILATHCHADHAGGLKRLAEATGAQVGTHKLEAERIQAGGRYREDEARSGDREENIWRTRISPVSVDLPFQDGAELPGGIVALHTPGHTRGHTCFLHPGEGFLLVGDALFNFPPLTGPVAAFDWDIERSLASVLRLVDVDVDAIGFGHGPPMTSDATAQLRKLLGDGADA